MRTQQDVLRTQQDVYRRLILEILFIASDHTMAVADVFDAVAERYGHDLNAIDRKEEGSKKERKWQTRVRKTSSDMTKDGLLERPAWGIWRLTSQGLAAVKPPVPPYYGDVPGIQLGKVFTNRMVACKAGVHPANRAGIAGPETGAYSICLSEGYSDDGFIGDLITYTGAGGINKETKRHVSDQKLTGQNLGLVRDFENGQPVRVLVQRLVLTGQPKDVDYIYLGLYNIISWSWGKRDGFKILLFQLRGVPGNSLSAGNAVNYLEEKTMEAPDRKLTVVNRIQRDFKVTQAIKSIYSHRCQACETELFTAAGPYSEGAHIRPLGAPHNGPDTLGNMLCLCPNCHIMFDGRSLWIDREGMVHIVDKPLRKLDVDKKHPLDFKQLAYHRELCGRSTPLD